MNGIKGAALGAATSEPLLPLWKPLTDDLIVVLTLHRFTDPNLGITGHSIAELRANLAFLRRHKFRFASLHELIASQEPVPAKPRPTVVFTVDDGYADFASVAAPVFAEFDCPVTVFLVTSPVDGGAWYWWDRVEYILEHTKRTSVELPVGRRTLEWRWSSVAERAFVVASLTESLKMVRDADKDLALVALSERLEVDVPRSPPSRYAAMTWSDVRQCAAKGFTFGPHTVSHPILPNATRAQVEWEVKESWRRLQEECPGAVPVFSYPNGAFSSREVAIVRAANLSAALTTKPQYASYRAWQTAAGDTRFGVPRFAYNGMPAQFARVVTGLERLIMGVRDGREGWVPIGAEHRLPQALRR